MARHACEGLNCGSCLQHCCSARPCPTASPRVAMRLLTCSTACSACSARSLGSSAQNPEHVSKTTNKRLIDSRVMTLRIQHSARRASCAWDPGVALCSQQISSQPVVSWGSTVHSADQLTSCGLHRFTRPFGWGTCPSAKGGSPITAATS